MLQPQTGSVQEPELDFRTNRPEQLKTATTDSFLQHVAYMLSLVSVQFYLNGPGVPPEPIRKVFGGASPVSMVQYHCKRCAS